MDPDRLQRVLGAAYLGDLRQRSMDELRAMRGECQELEVGISYRRRLAQGRLDIVEAVVRKRLEGGDPVDVASLIQDLGRILSDHTRTPGVGRLPKLMIPAPDETAWPELDRLLPAGRLGDLPELPDDELESLIADVRELEHEISATRRALHERIDAVQAEMTRRYRTGEATVESLLH